MKEQILAVQRMQDYIEKHLTETITLADLASVSLFSPWHSHRMFKEQTGLTPAEYIRRLRLSKSALRLRDEKCKVIDVAFDLGFGSADGYTRAFFREFGCTPGEYAARPFPIPLFIPYGVKFRNLRKDACEMEEVRNVFIQVIEKPKRKVIIKRGVKAADYFAYCGEVGCDVWGILTSMTWDAFLDKYKDYVTEESLLLELTFDDPSITDVDKCLYEICIQVDEDCPLENTRIIPGGKYAVYHFEGYTKEIYAAYQGIFNSWLPRSGYKIDERYSFEIYRNVDCDSMCMKIDFCIPIK